jgi:nitroreductase
MNTMIKEEFYNLLKARRSIRKFKKDPVPKEVIERLLAAAV